MGTAAPRRSGRDCSFPGPRFPGALPPPLSATRVCWRCPKSLFLDGCSVLQASDGQRGAPLPDILFSGPQTKPVTSWNPGPVRAMALAFYPDAWEPLTGRCIEDLIDVIAPLAAADGGALARASAAALEADDCEESFQRFQDFLEPLWRGARSSSRPANWARDWAKSVSARAALSIAGRGARQAQRRVKSWTGQSQRRISLHAKAEGAFEHFMKARRAGAVDQAGLALDAGFSDQSHMGRLVRRITGESPARIERLIDTDERYWFYRLVGEIY
jgi:hypothetical protein